MSFTQYLKDTRGELNHVAWPTRAQTIVYTTLVVLISVGIALYLGLFDFLFTSGLARVLNVVAPDAQVTSPIQVTQQPVTTSTATTTQ
jgi:preprotein translocase SecE subunit